MTSNLHLNYIKTANQSARQRIIQSTIYPIYSLNNSRQGLLYVVS